MDDKKLFWWGTNGTISKQTTPIEHKLSNDNLLPIRLQTTWCKTMSLIYATMANTTKLKTTYLS